MSSRRKAPGSKPTIKDVARMCEVSTQTVSRVLNRRPDVSPDTRERILQVISDLGYQPSALARSLIQRRSFTLGVIIAGLKYVGISQTLNGITEQADQEGYSLLLEELPSFDVTDVQPVIRSLLSHQVEAIIYAAPEIGDNWRNVQAQRPNPCPPIVFLKGSPCEGISTISINNYRGACLAVRHLYEQGCRRIAHISGPLDWWETRERLRGWKDTLKVLGLPAGPEQCTGANWSSAGGEKAFRTLLESFPQMDGIFAANDQMALAVLHVANQVGINVPRQLAVVGFDDLAESAYYSPALTTVRQDLRSLGTLAVKKAIQMVNLSPVPEGETLPETILLEPYLMVRSSSMLGK